MERVHVWVSGLVQGVWFRASAEREAIARGLTGWVRNLPDGRVEALAEGSRPALERYVDWCRQGPPAARVDDVKVEWLPATGEFDGFELRR